MKKYIKNLDNVVESTLRESLVTDAAELVGIEEDDAEERIKGLSFANYIELGNAIELEDAETVREILSTVAPIEETSGAGGVGAGAVGAGGGDCGGVTAANGYGGIGTWDGKKRKKKKSPQKNLGKGVYEDNVDEEKLLDKPTPTLKDLAKKHDMPLADMGVQLAKGIKAEKEHTTDMLVAKEIALDHLNELPDYYDRLEKMEESRQFGIYRKSKAQLDSDDGHTAAASAQVKRGGKHLTFKNKKEADKWVENNAKGENLFVRKVSKSVKEADNPYAATPAQPTPQATPPSTAASSIDALAQPTDTAQQNDTEDNQRKDVDDLSVGDPIEVIDIGGDPTAVKVKNPRGPGETLIVQTDKGEEHIVKKMAVSGTPTIQEMYENALSEISRSELNRDPEYKSTDPQDYSIMVVVPTDDGGTAKFPVNIMRMRPKVGDFAVQVTTRTPSEGQFSVGSFYTGDIPEAKFYSQGKQIKADDAYNLYVKRKEAKELTYESALTDRIVEVAPPGMEGWIKKRKPEFKKRYGDDWESVLYATAWKQKNNESLEEELDDSYRDEWDKEDARVADLNDQVWGDLGFKRHKNWPGGTTQIAHGDLRKAVRAKYKQEGWEKEYPTDKRDQWYVHPTLPLKSAMQYEPGITFITSMGTSKLFGVEEARNAGGTDFEAVKNRIVDNEFAIAQEEGFLDDLRRKQLKRLRTITSPKKFVAAYKRVTGATDWDLSDELLDLQHVEEARNASNTEHSGAKKGRGGYYGRKKDAKSDSNKKRRANDKKAVDENFDPATHVNVEHRDPEGRFIIVHAAPAGYWAVGQGRYSQDIDRTGFDNFDDALEHAELCLSSIDESLDVNEIRRLAGLKETASAGATGAGAVATAPTAMGGVVKRSPSIYDKPKPKKRTKESNDDGIGRSKKK
jgi:hypothetical protein